MPPSENTKLPLAAFLTRYRKQTGNVYRSGLLDFFDFISEKRIRGKKATDDDMKVYEAYATRYLSDGRNYASDLVSYVKHLDTSEALPKTAHTRVQSVKEFLSFNEIELNKNTIKDLKRLKPKGGRRTDFEYIDKTNLAEILHHVDARGKAFILVAATSGARLGEILALTWSNIKVPDRSKYPDKPTSIFIRTSKTGNSRTTYITRECELALDEWKKVYSVYREFATKRSRNLKNEGVIKKNDDTRVFPFTSTSVYRMWDDALTKSGHFNKDEGTRRVQMNIHRLRNFFSVQVASASTAQVSEYLMGHSDQYGDAYKGRSIADWERAYMKAEPALTIGTTSSQIEATSREVSDLRKQVDTLTAQLETSKAIDDRVQSREDIILEIMTRLKKQ